MEGLLAAAQPQATSRRLVAWSEAWSVAAAASTLSKLGLKPETIARFAPTLVKAVQSNAGTEVGALLAGALK